MYQMILRALKLRAQINLFCSYTYKDNFIDEMQLNEDDWYILSHLAAALVYFENATMALQGQAQNSEFGTMAECIPIIEALSLELTELQTRFPLNSTFELTEINDLPNLFDTNTFPPRTGDDPASGFILECTNRAHAKLSQYYGLTDESVWFTAGMIMNPTIKWKWCKVHWVDKPEWLQQAQANMRQLWQSYKPTQSSLSRKRQLPNRGIQPAKLVKREANYRDSTLYGYLGEDTDEEEASTLDEYEEYIQEKRLPLPQDCHDTATLLLDYWKDHAKRWPNLTRLAFDALSIPAMSAECERCFSSAKNMISDSRYSLSPESIEACECNRHWIMHKTAS
jgi:hAT family C-terminal dimerisation region